jgi:CRP/FNR family transcriptional regulator, anaerobic regulatory protein
MKSTSRSRGRTDGAFARPQGGARPAALSVLAKGIAPHAVTIRTRRRQRILPASEGDEFVYIIGSGAHTMDATLPGARHQILEILYPGDIVRSSRMLLLSATGITSCAAAGEIWRLRWPQLEALAHSDPEIARHLHNRKTEQAARLAMHTAIIGGLPGDARVASLFLEFVERIGTPVASGIAFELPLSRADVADYLALNADTVSRIVSRLRAKGLISQSGRSRFVCRDKRALAGECPIARALTAMHKPGAVSAKA